MKPVEIRVRLEVIYDSGTSLHLERRESWEELSRIKGMSVFDALKEVARILINHLQDAYEKEHRPEWWGQDWASKPRHS